MSSVELASVSETVLLEELLDGECACESKHVSTVCSLKVVARMACSCGMDILCCGSLVRWSVETINGRCLWCAGFVAECWRVIPV